MCWCQRFSVNVYRVQETVPKDVEKKTFAILELQYFGHFLNDSTEEVKKKKKRLFL